jgi:hyperosmotically inducible protein
MNVMKLAIAAMAALVLSSPVLADKSAGDTVDDNTLAASVKTALIGESAVKARDINVEVYKGRVQLAGFMDDQAMINKAVETAKGVKGQKEVINRLAVRAPKRSMGTTMDDTTMAGKVKAAIADSDASKTLDVNVEVNDGVVLLSGFVPGASAKSGAEAAAKKAGAGKVLNYIDVQ